MSVSGLLGTERGDQDRPALADKEALGVPGLANLVRQLLEQPRRSGDPRPGNEQGLGRLCPPLSRRQLDRKWRRLPDMLDLQCLRGSRFAGMGRGAQSLDIHSEVPAQVFDPPYLRGILRLELFDLLLDI